MTSKPSSRKMLDEPSSISLSDVSKKGRTITRGNAIDVEIEDRWTETDTGTGTVLEVSDPTEVDVAAGAAVPRRQMPTRQTAVRRSPNASGITARRLWLRASFRPSDGPRRSRGESVSETEIGSEIAIGTGSATVIVNVTAIAIVIGIETIVTTALAAMKMATTTARDVPAKRSASDTSAAAQSEVGHMMSSLMGTSARLSGAGVPTTTRIEGTQR